MDAVASDAHREATRFRGTNARRIEHIGPPTAPIIPVMIVSVAVTAGAPPIMRDISIDTAAVADFGASDRTVDTDACATTATDPQRC